MDLNRHNSTKGIQMAKKHMRRCSIWLVIMEMQIKTTSYYFTPAGMAKIRKTDNIEYWQGCEDIGSLVHCWWNSKMVQPLWKAVCQLFKMLSIKLLYDQAVPLLDIYPREIKTYIHTNPCTEMFIEALVKIGKM